MKKTYRQKTSKIKFLNNIAFLSKIRCNWITPTVITTPKFSQLSLIQEIQTPEVTQRKGNGENMERKRKERRTVQKRVKSKRMFLKITPLFAFIAAKKDI